jgi:signal transduction histidine kinase
VRLRPHDPGLALALAFLAGHAVERPINPDQTGSIAGNAVAAVLMSVPLYWLRTRPVPSVVALVAAAVAGNALGTDTQDLFVALILIIVVGFSLARHHEGRARWIPLGIVAASLTTAEMVAGSQDPQFVLILLAGGAFGGGALRRRETLTRELAERTHELEALRELRERHAVLDERRRIARELHDVVAHTVSIMVVQSGGARRQLARDPQRALAALDQVDATGREALAELDRLFGLLQSDAAAPTGLGDLPALVRRTREAGLPTELAVHGTPGALPADADLAAYRLVQEALTNALKHAGPDATVAVAVRWQDDAVEIAVTDTGRGLGGTPGEGSRRGLAGMRERLAAFGGDVEAGPRAGGGFEVRARLPVRAREEVPA